MFLKRAQIKKLTVILCLLAVGALLAGGCSGRGSSGLTFYEFYDPT